MLCPSCNAPNREDAKFCKSCGQPLRSEQAKEIEQASAPVAPEQPINPTSEEGAQQQVATSLPSEPLEGNSPNGQEDPALAPTLILSPDKVMAYRSRFWRQNEVEESQDARVVGEANTADVAAVVTTPANSSPVQAADATQAPAADLPPVVSAQPTNTTQSASSQQETPPAFDAVAAPAFAEKPEEKEANLAMTSSPVPGNSPSEEEEAQQVSAPGEFAALPVGELLIGRYEITQVLNESADEHIYQVVDHQGYQHCWNCGSEQNAVGDEFCIDCGASMLNVIYTLHEYPASGNAANEANVLQGAIVNSFIEQGRTYAVEQISANQSAFLNGVQLLAASNSDAGNVRRSDPNEDSTLVLQLQRVHESLASPAGVFIVADGLGGHDNGQVASRMTVNIIAERMSRELLGTPLQAEKDGKTIEPPDEDDLVSLLRSTIEDANLALCQKNASDKTDMGSTLTGYMIVGEHAYIVNVGDSRTYMIRGEQIYQLTTDHSLVGQLVAGGLIEPDDVYTHPQRSQIFRSLGDKPNVQIDIFKQQLLPGDILLSCSDGLWEMVRNPQIESILTSAPDPQTACTQLIDAANTNGGEDNVSAVVVFVR